jgi:tape measure domain-containing protein
MTDFATLVLAADTRQMTQAEKAIDGVTKSGERAEKQTDKTSRAIDNMNKMARRAATALGLLGGALSIRQLAQYADTWTDLRARVDLATVSQEQSVQVMQRLQDMARRTFSSLQQTTEVYLSNATALRELGLSANASLNFTEAFNNALVVSGARAQQAESAQNALTNALALGSLQGQNLNTILTSGGRIAELLADSLDTTTLGLRQMASQGLITGDVIIQSLVGNLELLRQEADSMPATIGDAFTLMGNAALTLVGKYDEMLSASSMVADGIILLADNLERAVFVLGAAAAAFGVYRAAAVVASVATMGFATALGVARAALIRLGIGALIVGAGELAFQLSRLVERTGGWGKALELLGDVASGVWEGIKTSARSIEPALGAVWQDIKRSFNNLMSDLTAAWANFLVNIANAADSVPLLSGAFSGVANAAARATAASADYAESALVARDAAESLRQKSAGLASQGFDNARAALAKLNKTVDENTTETDGAADAADRLNAALENISGASGGETGGSAGAAANTVKELNEELQQTPRIVDDVANAWADFVVRGFRDFQGFVRSVISSFRNMLRDMIATAARNRIMISLGMTGAPSMASAGAGMLGGGGGMLGGIGALGSSFIGGATNAIGAFTGGLGTGFAAIGGQISAAMTGSFTAIAGAMGAVLGPLAIVAGLIKGIIGSTKLIDQGLKVTVQETETMVQQFRETERRRFFGLSRSRRTSISDAPSDVADPIGDAVSSIQQAAIDAAAALGIGADAFAGFSHEFNISLKGLNEQQAMQKVTEELGKLGDAFAGLAPGVSNMNELLGAAQQRYDLTTRLLQLQGEEEELLRRHREQELSAVHDLNREILLQIHSLEDQAIAAEKASIAAQERIFIESQLARERDAIERRALELQGNTAALRERELAALDPTNRALAETVFALEDAAAAAREATQAAEEAARRDRAISDEMSRLQTRLLQLQGDTAALRERELAALHPTNQALLELIFATEDQQRAAAEAAKAAQELADRQQNISREEAAIQARLLQLQGDTTALRERELAALDPANRALQEMIFAMEDQKRAAEDAARAAEQLASQERAITQERLNLQTRLLQLQGDTAALRERELAALHPTNRALLELIFALEDTQKAAEGAARAAEELAARQREIAQERFNLETRLLQLQGDTAALRERELAALDPSNRALLRLVFSIEDTQKAAEEAARAAEELAAKQREIAQERFNLETRLLQLQGDTAALRERELAALDPSNRALQKFIFGLEDAAAALNALSPSDFATAIDFERAQAQARIAIGRTPSFANGGVHRGGLRLVGESGPELEVTGPSNIFSHGDTMSMLSNKPMVAELRELRQEVARMRDEQRQLGIQTASSTDRSYRLLRSWDVIGLPEERTA